MSRRTRYEVLALVNVGEGHFDGYEPEHALAKVTDRQGREIVFQIDSFTPEGAANHMWVIGNKEAADADWQEWPRDIRSLSVGDVLTIREAGDTRLVMAIASMGFDTLPETPTNIVPIEGTHATSRK